MNASDIVGYTFNADNYCPNCIIGMFNGNSNDYDSEDMLSILASGLGIERWDEYSFDSSEFPKVIFADSVENGERCGNCHELLIEEWEE